MKSELLERLRCPDTRQELRIETDEARTDDIQTGWLVTADGAHRYPIRGGIPRFVPESTYADNFGMQWNYFRQTQLDSNSGHAISAERFWRSTGWDPAQLAGKWVLDAGCGSGRFAEIALAAGAHVVAMDLSVAVEATRANLERHGNLHVVQADIYRMPFAVDSFDYVYSLGVLQHTPDVAKAFCSLPPLVKPDGQLCVDYYRKSWKSALLPVYLVRPFTKRVPRAALFSALQRIVPTLLPLSRVLGSIPIAGRVVKRVVPIIEYYGVFPFTPKQHLEWALLDTFDVWAPEYDQPQSVATAREWMENARMRNIEVVNYGLVVARGTR